MATVIQKIAASLFAIKSERLTLQAFEFHQSTLRYIERECLPSGSGFDAKTIINVAASLANPEKKIVFTTHFHHMTEAGFYDRWTTHSVSVVPSLVFGFSLRVSGKNKNSIREYIADTFYEALTQEFDAERAPQFSDFAASEVAA